MAGLDVDVDVDVVAADDLLDGIETRLTNADPLLRFLGAKMADYEAGAFATRGFGSWAPLDPDTVAGKGSARVLVDSGDLLDGLTNPGAGNLQVTADSVRLHTAEKSAVFLRRGARGMPVRDPIPSPSRARVSEWAEDLIGALVDGTGIRG